MVDDELSAQTASGRASHALIQELRDRDITVIEATSDADGQAVVLSRSIAGKHANDLDSI